MKTITLTKPDDWHIHFRDSEYLATTVAATAKQFARALVMPNLRPPVLTAADALAYQQRILSAIPNGLNFKPLMSLYLTDNTTPEIVKAAKKSGHVVAFKLYPAGATTHSAAGVTQLEKIYPALTAMMEENLLLLIHGEVTTPEVDIFAREQCFIEQVLIPLQKRFPTLRMVLEHITSEYAANWVATAPDNITATITAHHLWLDRNDLLVGGIHPHYYCLPIVKTQRDKMALIAAATSGNPKFFLGTDSAPHAQSQKESPCGCAGIFTAHAALELYATIFEQADALDKLEGFASFFGADFYQLPRNQEKISLTKQNWQVPEFYPYGKEKLIPFNAGKTLTWCSKENINE